MTKKQQNRTLLNTWISIATTPRSNIVIISDGFYIGHQIVEKQNNFAFYICKQAQGKGLMLLLIE